MLWKESLNSDGHQFQHFQQKEQSPLILTELTEHKKKNQHVTLEMSTTFVIFIDIVLSNIA